MSTALVGRAGSAVAPCLAAGLAALAAAAFGVVLVRRLQRGRGAGAGHHALVAAASAELGSAALE